MREYLELAMLTFDNWVVLVVLPLFAIIAGVVAIIAALPARKDSFTRYLEREL